MRAFWMKTTLSSLAICTPYQDPFDSKRTDGEVLPTLGMRLEPFSPAKKHS